MLGDNVLDRIVDKTINLCQENGIRTDREEIEKIFNHVIDRIRYLFDLQKTKFNKCRIHRSLKFW